MQVHVADDVRQDNVMALQFNANQRVSLDEARSYLNALDLNYIIVTMCAELYPLPRWSSEDAFHCSQLYKNFLFLQKKYASIPLVPTREIDEFWHNHILYTQNYFRDCLHIFGYYLHHEPASVTENSQRLIDNFVRTKELYLKEFKTPLVLLKD